MSLLTERHHGRAAKIRNRSLDAVCRHASLDRTARRMRRRSTASAARATICTSACARSFSSTPSTAFTFPLRAGAAAPAPIPFAGYTNLLKRRFEEAIESSWPPRPQRGPSAAISSALAAGYRALGFQTLADQVRRSVRSVRGNQWMFRTGHPADYPLRLRPELLRARRAGSSPSCAKPRPCAWT